MCVRASADSCQGLRVRVCIGVCACTHTHRCDLDNFGGAHSRHTNLTKRCNSVDYFFTFSLSVNPCTPIPSSSCIKLNDDFRYLCYFVI